MKREPLNKTIHSELEKEKKALKTYKEPELKYVGSIIDKTKATVLGNGADDNYS